MKPRSKKPQVLKPWQRREQMLDFLAWVLGYGVIVVIVIAIIVLWLSIKSALAEDYWSNCDEAYQFCEQRPFHRDCRIWTGHGEPLTVAREDTALKNPNYETAFCKQNPWHMSCGYGGVVRRWAETCPIPEKFHPVNGKMPWAGE